MFLTSDSICKNNTEQFAGLSASSELVCDSKKCGTNPQVCTQVCIPTTVDGPRKCIKYDESIIKKCIKTAPTKITKSCGKIGPLVCSPGTPKCC